MFGINLNETEKTIAQSDRNIKTILFEIMRQIVDIKLFLSFKHYKCICNKWLNILRNRLRNLPGGFSKKHNAFYFSAYSMHFAFNSKQPVSLHRNCIKITFFCVNTFSSWRIHKQPIADFAFKRDFSSFTLLEAKNINNFHCSKILFLKLRNFGCLIISFLHLTI